MKIINACDNLMIIDYCHNHYHNHNNYNHYHKHYKNDHQSYDAVTDAVVANED